MYCTVAYIQPVVSLQFVICSTAWAKMVTWCHLSNISAMEQKELLLDSVLCTDEEDEKVGAEGRGKKGGREGGNPPGEI